MSEEIIEHEQQTYLDQFLHEKNEKCENCRWCSDLTCLNSASEYHLCKIEFVETKDCEQYYPNSDLELFSSDEDTGSLFNE